MSSLQSQPFQEVEVKRPGVQGYLLPRRFSTSLEYLSYLSQCFKVNKNIMQYNISGHNFSSGIY